MSLYEYYAIVDGYRAKQLEELKTIRWQTWQIVRHNPFLKTPPASPEKLLKFADEEQADEERNVRAAEKLKEAIKNHGRR